MQAAGVLWPGLQVDKTIKERKALHETRRLAVLQPAASMLS